MWFASGMRELCQMEYACARQAVCMRTAHTILAPNCRGVGHSASARPPPQQPHRRRRARDWKKTQRGRAPGLHAHSATVCVAQACANAGTRPPAQRASRKGTGHFPTVLVGYSPRRGGMAIADVLTALLDVLSTHLHNSSPSTAASPTVHQSGEAPCSPVQPAMHTVLPEAGANAPAGVVFREGHVGRSERPALRSDQRTRLFSETRML